MESLELKHFRPHEVRFLGNSHYSSGKAQGLNTLPPKALRARLIPVLRAADEARERLGTTIVILSGYRAPAYNRAIGGAKFSRHMECDALDIAAPKIPTSKLRACLKQLRKEGWFKGGLGLKYPSFVHLDNRGTNVDF
ncbi:MAG: D-Ala-D-Ala carboxypeptidase family metallohydrolase [Akkermansiaceae bacterium]|nr:D-Ala-D-Ala carboxypeptidase family metallohydrolase [Akkermansiaceae bacterium]